MREGHLGVTVIDRSSILGTALLDALIARGVQAEWKMPPLDDTASLAQNVVVHASGIEDVSVIRCAAEGARVVSTIVDDEAEALVVTSFIRAGAQHVIPDTTTLDVLVAVILDDSTDVSVVPSDALASFVDSARSDAAVGLLSDEEVSWISSLAAGAKVSTLAARSGYSERSMFRHLARIYRILGVSNRDEALFVAQQLGLSKDEAPTIDDGDDRRSTHRS